MAADLDARRILEMIPQRPPFRFVDRIDEIDDDHVVASYRFREDEFFYAGHFPGDPVTPGVILVETIAQCAVVPLAIRLLANESHEADLHDLLTLFTDADVEFQSVVRPGERVLVEARKLYFRRGKLRVEATLRRADGTIACNGTLSGMGIFRAPRARRTEPAPTGASA